MNLQIRDPRAHALAQRLAKRRGVSMTEAVVGALQSELERLPVQAPLWERIRPIVDGLAAEAKPGGRDLTKEEITEMWGDP